MSNADSHVVPGLVAGCSFLASVAVSGILHTAQSRADAAAVVPILIVWGAGVMLAVPAGDRPGVVPRLGVGVLAAAILVRAPLIGTPPLLSDDLYRYLFEGLAMNEGHNPFVTAPQALVGLDDALRANVNHPSVPTVYPPLALWWFRAMALGGTPATVQAATALADVGTVAALQVATRRHWPAWLYALHPLGVLESAHGAHIDVLGVALAAAGVAAWRRESPVAAWVAFLGGGAVKLLPATLLPTVARRLGWRTTVALAIPSAAALVLLASPVLAAGPALLDGFTRYASAWDFNGFVFPWVASAADVARPLLVMVGAAIGLAAFWRHRDPGLVWGIIGGAFVLLSPTVHPWYVLWAVVGGLCCARRGWAAAAVPLLASYSVLLAYDPATGQWSEAWWLWGVTWPPAVLLLLWHQRREYTATAPYPAANSRRNGSDPTSPA